MNWFIESLNGWGARFLQLAGPMLWQSTVLIALVCLGEFALRRKVRPAVRYALWLAVLVKLILPPSLASPTSVAWWLRSAAPTPVQEPPLRLVVTANTVARPIPPAVPAAPVALPKPARLRPPLSTAAWLLIAWSATSVGLFGWLVTRWQCVVKKVRRVATTPSPASGVALQELFDEAKRAAGVRRVVRLRLVEAAISPAVYGLFRPVILLPRSLVERIGPGQLRAVLVHELIHFRRGDVWINCAQSLLQIVYWWHPLVWLANTRIRRVREEAVDDAVMLALRGEADHYAPALLEVAKLALNRPLTTLALVGILESRSALQHRVERLMNSSTPRRAGLSIASALGIAAFSALAVPMGEAPPGTRPVAVAQVSPESGQGTLIDSAGQREPSDDEFDLKSDHTTFYSPGGVTQARGNVVIRFHGQTITADSAFVSQAAGILFASGHVVLHRDHVPLSFDFLNFNFRSGDMRGGDSSNGIPRGSAQIAIRVQADGTYWMGTHSLDLSQLRVVLQAAKESVQEPADKLGIRIESVESAPYGAFVQLADLCKEIGFKVISTRTIHENSQGSDSLTGKWDFDAAYGRYFWRGIQGIERSRAEAIATNLAAAIASGYPTNLIHTDRARLTIMSKLDRIRIARFSCDNELLADVVRRLTVESKDSDPEKEGVHIVIDSAGSAAASTAPTIDPSTGLPISAGSAQSSDVGTFVVNLKAPLRDISLADALDAIVKATDKPVRYSVRDDAVVFTAQAPKPELHIRSFRVDPNTFYKRLQDFGADSSPEGLGPVLPSPTGVPRVGVGGLQFVTATNSLGAVQSALINFFLSVGVDLRPGTGKNVFYSDGSGMLVFNATSQDLDIIEAALQALNAPAPEINLKVKFVELDLTNPPAADEDPVFVPIFRLPSAGSADDTNAAFALTGILTAPQFSKILRELERRPGSDVLDEGQVTTLSGRQAQIQITDLNYLGAIAVDKIRTSTNRANIPASEIFPTTLPLGPTVDLIPYLESDGYTIRLTVIPTILEMDRGEAAEMVTATTSTGNSYSNGIPAVVSVPLPHVRVRQATMQAIVFDGQTLVVGGRVRGRFRRVTDKVPVLGDVPHLGPLFRSESTVPDKVLILFVTPTVVHPDGSRVHPDEK